LNSSTHLSEDQIDDLLIGYLATEPAAHLATCEPCQLRVSEAKAPIANFKAVSLAWSERRSATLPSQLSRAKTPSWHRPAAWAATATAVLLVGIAVPMAKHDAHSNASVTSTTTSVAEASNASTQPQIAAASTQTIAQSHRAEVRTIALTSSDNAQDDQIARDNQMLLAIDRELDTSVQSPADTFGYTTSGSRSIGHGRNAPAPTWD